MKFHFPHTAYRLPLTLLVLFCLFISCKQKTFYQKMDHLPNETWNIDTTLTYEFTISDSLQYYNFYIDVRNTTDYPYQNLYLFFTTQFPDSTMFTDTLNCILSDAHGRWTGRGSGKIKQNRFVLKPKVRFPQTGTYIFSAQQAMRTDDLKGIANFGITLQNE
ncbi:MAG: gliding motility lipoprotein GldH [Bacteroidetes bacterium]|nr:gliding motility lipoprotein GldH [Bacteroidota bacterium]MCL2302217.1 gliding motility lipoprotein GldH [Lentimicrobiaceae bacterium]MCL2302297.1 gliding motility lipoprotein GldH [Lentimicrobiaceae bacterium]